MSVPRERFGSTAPENLRDARSTKNVNIWFIFRVISRPIYTRFLPTLTRSIFLFGSRGTGKSIWLRDRFPAAYDLLDTGEALRLSKEPQALYRELSILPVGAWAIVDEVQKVPELLDEVHRLMENCGLRFVLSGSSARKLRRSSANLLAGRAVTTSMFPLASAELSFEFDPQWALLFGTLPMTMTTESPQDYLRTYAETYLAEEIRAEAVVRNFGPFARFLEIAARQNAQVTNAASVARDAGISRRTAQNHFDILTDTLIGFRLPAWKLKSATRRVQHDKFYFFDCGGVRALTGRLPYPPAAEELGPLAETFVLAELRAYLGYSGRNYRLAATTARRSRSSARRRTVSSRSKSRRPRDGTSATTAACAGSGTTSARVKPDTTAYIWANGRRCGTISGASPDGFSQAAVG